MKTLHYLIIGFCALSILSCKDEKKDSVTYIKDTTASVVAVQEPVMEANQNYFAEGKTVKITTDKVPQPVTISFSKKYPNVLTPIWMEYTPVASDDMPMDDTYYYTQYADNGINYDSWYSNTGEWVKTSTDVPDISGVPPAVSKAIGAQFADYKVDKVKKEMSSKGEWYKVKMSKGDSAGVKIKVMSNGEIMKIK